jgi:hypothetical protein
MRDVFWMLRFPQGVFIDELAWQNSVVRDGYLEHLITLRSLAYRGRLITYEDPFQCGRHPVGALFAVAESLAQNGIRSVSRVKQFHGYAPFVGYLDSAAQGALPLGQVAGST